MKIKTVYIQLILIAIFGFIAYSNSLHGKFIWDDEKLIRDNPRIKSISFLPKIFTEDIGAGTQAEYPFYRPLQMFTYIIDYYFGKLNVAGYHLTNIGLHILAGLGVFWLISILYGERLLAFLSAIFWVVHPIHTEAVAYISGRADILAAVFTLLCIILYISHSKKENAVLFGFVLISYVFALLSKEQSLILPVLLMLYHYVSKNRPRAKEFLPVAAITTGYILLRLTLLKPQAAYSYSAVSNLFQRIPGFFTAITNYVRLLFLPFDLHMEYGTRLFHFSSPGVILGVIIVIVSITYAWSRRFKNKLVFFSVGWFFITLLPVSNLYPLNAYMAEHWLYLPSIGFFLILTNGLKALYFKKSFRIPVVFFTMGLLFFYSYLTIRQNNYWKEPLGFFQRAVKYAPSSPGILYNLGNVYKDMGKNEETIRLYQKAIELNPNFAEVHSNLGVVYKEAGKNEEAIRLFKKAMALNPNFAEAFYNLGVMYKDMGKGEEVISLYEKALALKPDYIEAYNNLASIYKDVGKSEEAIRLWNKALEINSDFWESHYNLGVIYRDTGRNEEASVCFKKALSLRKCSQ